MQLSQRIAIFRELYQRLRQLDEEIIHLWCRQAENNNSWFTPESTKMALQGLIQYLEPENFEKWARSYVGESTDSPKKIGVIMAGNIPMVGIHDLLCVLVSGHTINAKLSSQDPFLIKAIVGIIREIDENFAQYVRFDERMNDVDALIATGSDNSARYFEYYFKDKPKIIRKNRTSIGILTGKESTEDYEALSSDLFTYFGLGCRNVSKVYAPKGHDFTPLLRTLEDTGKALIDNHKYSNNYDYNKSIYLVNQTPHLDNGYLLLTESEQLVSPISVLYYQTYESDSHLTELIQEQKDKIQCIVSKNAEYSNSFAFGLAQHPALTDYADNVDTMAFLQKL